MALMASKPHTCTSLPAALCENHFSRGGPWHRVLSVSGCVLANFWLLLAVSWPLLASLGDPSDGSVVPFGLCYAALVVFGPRRHTSNLDLATFGTGPGWIFCTFHLVFANALGPSRWIALLRG